MKLERVLQSWRGLAPRERRIIAVGGVLLALVMLYAVAFEPAWRGRRALQAQLPAMRAELARLDAMAQEVQQLRGASAPASPSPQRVRAQWDAALQAAGWAQGPHAVTVAGSLVDLRVQGVPANPFLLWLDGALSETRWRVVDAIFERAGAPGRVDVRLTLEGAAAP